MFDQNLQDPPSLLPNPYCLLRAVIGCPPSDFGPDSHSTVSGGPIWAIPDWIMTVLVDTRADLTLEAARRVAWEGEGVELGARALAAMAHGRDRLERILDHDPEVTIYGVTTGPGQLAGTKLTPEQREQWAGMPPVGAAVSWGDPLPERVVRAIVLARLANFVEGHAGVSPEIARGVAAMLDQDRMPGVPAQGPGRSGRDPFAEPPVHRSGREGQARYQGCAVPDQRVAVRHRPCHRCRACRRQPVRSGGADLCAVL